MFLRFFQHHVVRLGFALFRLGDKQFRKGQSGRSCHHARRYQMRRLGAVRDVGSQHRSGNGRKARRHYHMDFRSGQMLFKHRTELVFIVHDISISLSRSPLCTDELTAATLSGRGKCLPHKLCSRRP